MKKAGYTKEQHEEAAGMGLEDAFMSQHDQPCDCAICDDIAFRRSLRKNHGCTVMGEKVCFACGECNPILAGEHVARFEKWWSECVKKDWIQAKDYAQHAYIAGYGQSVERIEKWKCWYESVSAAEAESRQRMQKLCVALDRILGCQTLQRAIDLAREALADRP